jgi:hypothetical protein
LFYSLPTFCTKYLEVGPLAETYFFSAEDYTNMSYYNCCGIRPKHSNISKRVVEGIITICVVLDQSTVIFQKGGGGITICVVLDQSQGNVMFYQLVSNLQSMFPS